MKTKAQKPEIQALVLQTATDLIARRGPRGWSTADLARRCGLAKNTLYKIIGSRERLVQTVVLAQIDSTTGLIKEIIRREKGYRPAARRLLEEGPAALAERPRVTFPDIFLEFPGVGSMALEHQQKAAEEIIAFIRLGQAGGHIRGDMEPEFLYDLVRGIVEHYTGSGLQGGSLAHALRKAFTCLREGIRLGNW